MGADGGTCINMVPACLWAALTIQPVKLSIVLEVSHSSGGGSCMGGHAGPRIHRRLVKGGWAGRRASSLRLRPCMRDQGASTPRALYS